MVVNSLPEGFDTKTTFSLEIRQQVKIVAVKGIGVVVERAKKGGPKYEN